MKKNLTTLFTICFLTMTLSLVLVSCDSKAPEETTVQGPYFFLNSILNVNILDESKNNDEIYSEVQKLVQDYEKKFTTNSPDSEVSLISKNAGLKPVKVSKSTFELIKESLHYSQISNGSFDITVAPLVKLWGIGTPDQHLPTDGQINEALSLIDYNQISLNEDENSIYLKNKGMSIDLGGIAKGYVTDKIVELLEQKGVKSAIVNMGGNVYVLGDKNGKNFNVGIRDGFSKDPSECFCIYKGSNISVVSSGVYERNFEQDGKTYHHILSTNDGYPVDNDVFATTIVCKSSTKADALSTAVFALGVEKGLDLINAMPEVQCMIVTKDKYVYLSEGMKDDLEIVDKSYIIRDDL